MHGFISFTILTTYINVTKQAIISLFLLIVHYTCPSIIHKYHFGFTSGLFSNSSVYVFLITILYMKNYIFIGLTSHLSVNNFLHLAFPGQIELFTHVPVLRNFVEHLKRKNFNVCAVYLLDSQVWIMNRNFLGNEDTLNKNTSLISVVFSWSSLSVM